MSCGLLFFFFLLFLASSCCLVFHASDLPFLCVSSCRVTERAVFLSSRHTGNVAVKNKLSHLFHALQKPQWLNIGVSNDQNKLLKQWCLVFFFLILFKPQSVVLIVSVGHAELFWLLKTQELPQHWVATFGEHTDTGELTYCVALLLSCGVCVSLVLEPHGSMT